VSDGIPLLGTTGTSYSLATSQMTLCQGFLLAPYLHVIGTGLQGTAPVELRGISKSIGGAIERPRIANGAASYFRFSSDFAAAAKVAAQRHLLRSLIKSP
jgi:hypothetical protein